MINWTRIEELSMTSSVKELMAKLSAYSGDVGFDNFGLAVQFSDSYFGRSEFFSHDNYQNGWKDSFARLADRSVASCDARVLVSMHKMPGVVWATTGEISYSHPLEKHADEIRAQLNSTLSFGIKSGVTIPLTLQSMDWGFVTFTCNSNRSISELESQLLDSMHYVSYSSSVFERFTAEQKCKGGLTGREQDTLKWAAIGKTSWEIASILKISERTVNFHLSNAAVKLNVTGRRAACSIAIARGAISI